MQKLLLKPGIININPEINKLQAQQFSAADKIWQFFQCKAFQKFCLLLMGFFF